MYDGEGHFVHDFGLAQVSQGGETWGKVSGVFCSWHVTQHDLLNFFQIALCLQ